MDFDLHRIYDWIGLRVCIGCNLFRGVCMNMSDKAINERLMGATILSNAIAVASGPPVWFGPEMRCEGLEPALVRYNREDLLDQAVRNVRDGGIVERACVGNMGHALLWPGSIDGWNNIYDHVVGIIRAEFSRLSRGTE